MRTKTLLIAAAALAATVISSQAQTVYSQNIVGYANSQFAPYSTYAIVAPLQGTTNAADQVLPAIQPYDELLIWNGSGYNSFTYIGPGNGNPPGLNWNDVNNNPTNAPALNPGEGFFYLTSGGYQETNTFTGAVLLTNSVPFAAYTTYMVGSTPPVAGAADDTNTINLPLQPYDELLIWNGGGYNSFTYIGPGNGNPPGLNWNDVNNNPTNAPSISVAQGFFYLTSGGYSETWTNSVNVQ